MSLTLTSKQVLGNFDLFSWFIDFAFYLDTQLVGLSTFFFQIMSEYDQSFDSSVLIGH